MRLHRVLKNKLLTCLLVSLVSFAVFSSLYLGGAFRTWQLSAGDALYPGGNPSREIVIVAVDDRSLQELGRWPWDRSLFAQALEKLQEAKVVGIDISFFEPSGQDQELQDALSSKVVLAAEYTSFSERDGKLYGEGLLKPVFSGAETGAVNLFTDPDGVTRSFASPIEGEETLKGFSALVAEKYLNREVELPQERMLINFYGGPGSFRTYSFTDLVNSRLNESFRGMAVLIGATSHDLHDEAYTPIARNRAMAGVEINANIVQTVILRDYIYRQDALSVIGAILALCILAGLMLYRFRLTISTALVAAMLLLYVLLSFWAFSSGVIMNLVHTVSSVILVYILVVVLFYVTEKSQRQWVTNIFGKYVSRHVASEILNTTTKDEVKLGGARREVTALFADIRGFTALSEKMEPEEVVDMLNHYMAAMADVIFKYDGTLDKFMGDCIMAFFNAPLDQPDHTLRAVRAALEMQEAAEKVSKKEGMPLARYGIGINTGPAVVGNMGSESRLEYTVLGDSINLASRMCSQAEAGQVVIPESTYKLVKGKVKARKLREVRVKGKEKPITVYQVLKVLG